MKRCPQCNRVETDETLKFCRVDGATLISESPTVNSEAGTGQFGSATASAEIETSILPHKTNDGVSRTTGRTTALPTPSTGSTGTLAKTKSHKTLIMIAVVVIIAIGLIIGLGIAGYSYLASRNNSAIESIAVLPFENRGRTVDTDYLSDGLADSLIYRLSQLPNLKVSPTSSVMKYKGQATDVGAIAKELQVDAVLSGRLMQQGDNLSISVQLVDSRNNKLIWAEQYERKMSDLLATQREIATSIAQKLQLKLAGNETGITKKYTNSNDAYQLYLKGRYHYAKRTKEDLQKGIDYFQRAVELDPNFALAYAMIADSYASMPAYPYLSPSEAFPKAKAAAQRAVEIDQTLSEAHSALGYSLALYDWKWSEAERAFKRAIELDEKNSLAHVRFAISYYQPTGRVAEAVAENERAVELEPVNLVARANLTWAYIMAGRNGDALGNGEKLRDLEPDFGLGRYQLGLAYIVNGMYQQAIELTQKPLRSDPNNQLMLQVAGYANAKLGKRNEANAVIARFKEIGKTQYVMSFFVATIHAGLGEKDKAFVELEDAYRQHDWRMSAVIKTEPMIESLREDARYKDLLKRMNLPE